MNFNQIVSHGDNLSLQLARLDLQKKLKHHPFKKTARIGYEKTFSNTTRTTFITFFVQILRKKYARSIPLAGNFDAKPVRTELRQLKSALLGDRRRKII